MVILTLATAAPDESVTVPSKVALTACPMTGAENPRSIVPSNTAMLRRHNLTRPAVAGSANSSLVIACDLFQLYIRRKDEPNSFFMASHPTRFEKTPAPIQRKTRYLWNWFHTLSERRPPVKSESRGTNGAHRFSNF